MKLKEQVKEQKSVWQEQLNKVIFAAVCPIGFKRIDKKLVPDPLTKDIVIRIFNLYFEGNSYSTIANIFNKEKYKVKQIGKIQEY